jgi:drug efflux transport system permease protein
VREKEIGTLEQLMVSPLKPWELMVGKTLPFALIGLVDLVLVTTVSLAWFEVPFEGSFLVLLAAALLFLVNGLGVGILISTISATQQEAFMSTFLVFMPTMLLSGFMFPVSSMPAAFRWVTLANPLRHFLEIIRGVFLKGTPMVSLLPQFAALTVTGILILTLAVTRFHKRAA